MNWSKLSVMMLASSDEWQNCHTTSCEGKIDDEIPWYNVRVQRKSFFRLPFRQAEEKASWRKGKLKLAFASPDVTSTNPQNFLTSRIDFTVPLLFNYSSKNITCPSDKSKTGFTSPIAKSTNPRLLDTTLHTECWPQFQVFLFWLKLLLGLLSLSYFPSIY